MVTTVPAGHYFVIRDNRDNSQDSRLRGHGTVPASNILGRVELVYLSVRDGDISWRFWTWPRLVRWERILMRMQ